MFDRYLKPEKYMDGQSVRAPNSLPLEILEPETSRFSLSNWPGNNDAIYFVRLRDGTCQGPNFVDQLKDVNWNWNAFLHVGSRSDMKDVLEAQRFRLREGWHRYHGFPSPEVESLFQNPDVQKVHWVTRSGYLNWVLYSKWDWALMRGCLDDIVAFKLEHETPYERYVRDLKALAADLRAAGALAEHQQRTHEAGSWRDASDLNLLRQERDKANQAADLIAKEREAWRKRAEQAEVEALREIELLQTCCEEVKAERNAVAQQLNALKAALWKLGSHWAGAKIPHFDLLSHSTRHNIRQFFLKELSEVAAPFPGKADAPDKDKAHYSARTGPVPGPRGTIVMPKRQPDDDRDDD